MDRPQSHQDLRARAWDWKLWRRGAHNLSNCHNGAQVVRTASGKYRLCIKMLMVSSVKPRRGMTVEQLRQEANAMERLAHKHILKLVGTYTFKRNNLYLLLYPVAVCDLSKLLEDVDEIRC